MLTCTIMVLNWNGEKWLQRCLPSVTEAARSVQAAVMIVDNGSSDESENLCRAKFPSVAFSRHENRFLASYNEAAAVSASDILVFLNNDIVVDRNFLLPLLDHFRGPREVFAVAPKVLSFPVAPDSQVEMEAESLLWTRGMLRGRPFTANGPALTRFCLGGAMACRRDRFLELGGFDELYLPGYHEDVDICWRAWKRGWACIYEPRSVVYHAGHGSIEQSRRMTAIKLRNEFLFHWKNLDSARFALAHIGNLPLRLAAAAIRRDMCRIKGFFYAVAKVPEMWAARRKIRGVAVVCDADCVKQINGAYVEGANNNV
ncbi:MAG TPA: glycosyltransferase family 2 protein [Humisphaera sp.]|jgi:hypothetical protein|nr:glycosyltransferase family 2 protein [Humisphaera sp.]